MLASSNRKRCVVIGAGPMGLETAVRAVAHGFEVTVLEAGRVGEHVRQWGHLRLFSPLGMNVSTHARKLLGHSMPADESIQTGAEYVATVLEPLARSASLRDKIVTDRKVVAITRVGLGKMGLPNHPLRMERSFKILAEDRAGREYVYLADLVFDASGVFAHGNWSGSGGVPALGERKLNARIIRHPRDLENEHERFAGKRILLIGHGHSAANTILALARIQQREPRTQITWAVRSDRTKPVLEVADDPLHERAKIVAAANALAEHPPENFRIMRRTMLEELQLAAGSAALLATLKVGKSFAQVESDEMISLTGYRPDLEMLRETTAEFSNVTEGARGLYKALANITDCLAKIEINPNDLQSGEPRLFVVGVKSYGRNPGFLLQAGNEQLDAIFSALSKEK